MMKLRVVQVLCLVGLMAVAFAQREVAHKKFSVQHENENVTPTPTPTPIPTVTASNQVMTVDLRTGSTSDLPSGMNWTSELTAGSGSCLCDRQGVLKLNFNSTLNRVRAQINMTFEESVAWTFNIGDSATNNGWAGDSGTQSNDAEVHSYHNTISFYGHDNEMGSSHGKLYEHQGFVGTTPYSTVSMSVSNELATADNGLQYLHVQSPHLFSLNGQSDTEGVVNHDLYLGMNRVVHSNSRNGRGLCRVTIQFFPA